MLHRIGWMRVVVVVAFGFLCLRIIDIQVLSAKQYAAVGAQEVSNVQKVSAIRGGIYDRNGAALALSVPTTDVIADPFRVTDPAGEAAKLATLLKVPVSTLQLQLSSDTGYVVLAKQRDSATAKAVTASDLAGITEQADVMRVDPAGTLAEPVLGATHADGTGSGGLEGQYQTLLAGLQGQQSEEVSPKGVPLPGSVHTLSAALPGTGIETTLDEPLQYVAEQALGAEVISAHAKSGIAIVMDTHTGDILAMANLVANSAGTAVEEAPQNNALLQAYEPGSVFKLVTFSAALQAGEISPKTEFTIPNSMMIDGATFHDAESHATEVLTATQILAQSSNLGTIQIATRVGAQGLAAQIANLGLGKPTGLDFPAETSGIVLKTSTWEPTDLADTAIGQDDSVTAQQMLDVANAVATGGEFVPPVLVRATIAPDGKATAVATPAPHRVMSQSVAGELTGMMESVTQDGTAVAANVTGYQVAGKTGTAQIPDPVNGKYIPGAYMATFAGFAPAQNPQLTAIVVLRQPTPDIYGGTTAAPVFAQIMSYALHRYGIPTAPGSANQQPGISQAIPYPAATPPSTIIPEGTTTNVQGTSSTANTSSRG